MGSESMDYDSTRRRSTQCTESWTDTVTINVIQSALSLNAFNKKYRFFFIEELSFKMAADAVAD